MKKKEELPSTEFGSMSYISYRLATITAAVIFFLVIILLILWTGFFSNTNGIAGVFDKDQSAAPIVHQQFNNSDKGHEDERREPQVSDRSVAAPLESNTTDISNEGKSLFLFYFLSFLFLLFHSLIFNQRPPRLK